MRVLALVYVLLWLQTHTCNVWFLCHIHVPAFVSPEHVVCPDTSFRSLEWSAAEPHSCSTCHMTACHEDPSPASTHHTHKSFIYATQQLHKLYYTVSSKGSITNLLLTLDDHDKGRQRHDNSPHWEDSQFLWTHPAQTWSLQHCDL